MAELTRVPLQLSGGPGVLYTLWPVTQGVPFAEGVLAAGTPVRVVSKAGEPFPTQAQCLTTWNADQRHVRWLLVDFQADLTPGEQFRLFLEAGAPPAPSQAVQVERDGSRLRVDTGPLQFELRYAWKAWEPPRVPDLLARCRVRGEDGWHELLTDSPVLYMLDQERRVYETTTAGPAPTVTVEDQGPLRASLCIRGYHASAEGVRFCPYILRLHFYAGRTDVRACHTFVFDQDPHQVELSSLGLYLPADVGSEPRGSLGGSEAFTGDAAHNTGASRQGSDAVHFASNFQELVLLQEDDHTYSVWRDNAPFGGGGRASGWACLSGRQGSVLAVLPEIWREYPKGLAVAPDGIDVQIWPEASGRNLKFTTPFEEPAIRFNRTRDEEEVKRLLAQNPTAPLNLKSFDIQSPEDLLWMEDVVDRLAPERAASHNDTGTGNGMGAAKTTEIVLRFNPTPMADKAAAAFAAAVREPLLAPADPVYACATGAFGHFHHAGEPRFAHVDAGLDMLMETVAMEPEERCGTYGMMRYGNAVCSHSAGPAVAYVHYKDTEPRKALRHVGPYNNEANDQILGMWGHFLRTGCREHFRRARAYSRCVADVAVIHAHTDPGQIGLMHYHNSHQWSGGGSPSHTLVSGILVDYYLTGDRRLLEVVQEVADWVVHSQEPAGILHCSGTLHREFTGPLWNLLEAYQATWREEYGALAQRSLNWFLRTLPQPGHYPVSVFTRGTRGDEAVVQPPTAPAGHARDVYVLYSIAMRLFPSRALRKHIIAEADYFVWQHLTDNFVTAEMARELLTPRSLLWPVDDEFYWTQWGVSGDYSSQIASLAYQLTGDLVYAAFCLDHLEGTFRRQVERCRHFADWRFTWLCFGSYVPRLMRTVADAAARDMDGLQQALRNWRAQRAARSRPVYTGPGVDLSRDRMDVNGNILNRNPVDLPREAPPRRYEPVTSLGRLSTEPHPQ